LNEELVKKILEIEKEAQEQYEAAVQEAKRLPLEAEVKARELVEKAQQEARTEAAALLVKAKSHYSPAQIFQTAEDEVKRKESVARLHMEQAVYFVLDRLQGKG